MKQAILDTDILSYVLGNRFPDVDAKAKQYFRVFRYFSISVITVSEIIKGLEATENYTGMAAFRSRVDEFEVFPIETDEALVAGNILGALSRTALPIGDLDPFIAATAIVNQRPLVTNNVDHYQRIIALGFPLTLERWRDA